MTDLEGVFEGVAMVTEAAAVVAALGVRVTGPSRRRMQCPCRWTRASACGLRWALPVCEALDEPVWLCVCEEKGVWLGIRLLVSDTEDVMLA